MSRTKIVIDLSTGTQSQVDYTLEEEAQADADYAAWLAAQALIDTSHVNSGKLIRFTGTLPVTVLDNTGLAGATRISKGRFRVSFGTPLPVSAYPVLPAYYDPTNIRLLRISARTDTFVEIRVTDTAGVAQDVAELTIEVKRVLS